MSMYYVFVFAIHKSLFSIHTMSKKSDFMCPDKFIKCKISGFRALLGSPWLATGSYFGKMTPRGPRAFLNRSRTSKLIFYIKYIYIIYIYIKKLPIYRPGGQIFNMYSGFGNIVIICLAPPL